MKLLFLLIQNRINGVPIRSEEDLLSFYKASKQGNNPLLRCYSGTRNLIKMVKLLHPFLEEKMNRNTLQDTSSQS